MSMEVFFLFLRRSHIFLTSDPAAKKGGLRPSYFALWVVLMPRVLRYACAEDGYIKCPHLPIIDGDILVAW